jgi:hypothetical protein
MWWNKTQVTTKLNSFGVDLIVLYLHFQIFDTAVNNMHARLGSGGISKLMKTEPQQQDCSSHVW